MIMLLTGCRTVAARYFGLAAFLSVVLFVSPVGVGAQQVSARQLQMLQDNPDLVRQQIRQSGLNDDQIRERLVAAGYPATLLDGFLEEPDSLVRPMVSLDALEALSSLGVEPGSAQGLEPVPESIGQQTIDSLRAEIRAAIDEAEDNQLFGLNVFRRTGALFQPTLGGPVPPTYRVGPGDEMVLVVTGNVELVHELSVAREGFVIIPQVGRVMVNNLTMAQMRTVLADRLGRSYSGIRDGTTAFDVSITRLRTIQVFVTGEVVQPSAYQLSSVATVLNAIYAAGGLTRNGNFRRIEVRRSGRVVSTFDLYDYLLEGNTEGDVGLEQGDVVFVPVHGTRALVQGAVVRPAVYELAPGQTLRDLVSAAGGFRADAALRRVSISRIVPARDRDPSGSVRVVVDVPLDQVEDGLAPQFPIEPGDVVTVAEIPGESRGFVEMAGAVIEPGSYGWRPGIRLSEIVARAGGVRSAVYTGRAHISRLNVADSTRFLVNVELPEDPTRTWPNDPVLRELDVVTIYSRVEFRAERTVTIGGMVNQPGTFDYHENMTLRDLVLRARGLRDGAYLDTVEVARLPEDRVGGRLAVTYRVPMDSTFLFEDSSSSYFQLPGISRAPATGTDDFLLRPFDQVSVLRQPDFELLRSVAITGEVAFPGPYALNSKEERLSNLVLRAGGLLPTAFAQGGRFFRTLGDAGQVNIELDRALERPGSRDDIVLQPGDSLHIPEFQPTVRVEGAVLAPASVLFSAGAKLDYYVENAGGYTKDADKGRVSVEYANGARRTRSGRFLLFGGSAPSPGPGSIVTVPLKDPSERMDAQRLITDLVAILGSITTVMIVALSR